MFATVFLQDLKWFQCPTAVHKGDPMGPQQNQEHFKVTTVSLNRIKGHYYSNLTTITTSPCRQQCCSTPYSSPETFFFCLRLVLDLAKYSSWSRPSLLLQNKTIAEACLFRKRVLVYFKIHLDRAMTLEAWYMPGCIINHFHFSHWHNV